MLKRFRYIAHAQGELYYTEATPPELGYLKAAEVVGVRSSSAQARRNRRIARVSRALHFD